MTKNKPALRWFEINDRKNNGFPSLSEFDMLIILGGPMGVYDEEMFPWLVAEKRFIKDAVRHRKLVLGICLGAQLIAEAIGGKVYENRYKEIGWHPIKLKEGAERSVFIAKFPVEYVPFHWHGDTFELPSSAKTIAFSKGCVNQAYEYRDHVIGLQFHLECSNNSIRELIKYAADDLQKGMYIQRPNEMLDQTGLLALSNALLFALLDAMERKHRSMA